MEKQMIETDAVEQALRESGWDFQEELDQLATQSQRLDLPRIRIEHKENGRHRIYVDTGESYVPDGQELKLPGNQLTAVVFAEQYIRALWKDGEQLPVCSGINDAPTVPQPVSDSCVGCQEAVIGSGQCKPKVRLLLLTEINEQIRPLIFNLPPTSIKHWNSHKHKLQRSKLPVVAVNTTFGLEDVKRNGYRWAEVQIGIDGIASTEMLTIAKQARSELQRITANIDQADFNEPGDRLPF